jgi:hypothetical protein
VVFKFNIQKHGIWKFIKYKYTGWFKALRQFLRRLLGRSLWTEMCFFQIRRRFRVTRHLRSGHYVLLYSFEGDSVLIVRGSTDS